MNLQSPPNDAPGDEVLAEARRLLENVQLANIRPVRLVADLADGDPTRIASTTEVRVEVGVAVDAGQYGCLFRYTVVPKDAEGSDIATIEASFVADYLVNEGFRPSEEAAHFFAGTTSAFAVYPYVREAVQGLSARLQINPVVLGLLQRGSATPVSIGTIVKPQAADTSEG